MAKKTETEPTDATAENTNDNETGSVENGTSDTTGITDTAGATEDSANSQAATPETTGKTPDATAENTNDKKAGSLKVKNINLAGKTVYGVTGKPIFFDAAGFAEPVAADYEHLLKVPGYEKA